MTKWRSPDDPELPKDGSPFLARIAGDGVIPDSVYIVRWTTDAWSRDGFSLSIGYRDEKAGRFNVRVFSGWLPCPKP